MKNFVSSILTSFVLTAFSISYGQEDPKKNFTLPEIIRPSPTVAQLMKFEEVDLNHYTGQPSIGMPLFSKSINGLNYSLALQYQVSGIRVNEQSGWVGKGWSLETGGVISRSVVGLPDDLNIPSMFIGINHNQFYDYWDWNILDTFNPNNPDPNSDAYKIREFYFDAQHAQDYQLDYQRDIYQFSFFGRTGRFLFVKENGVIVPKIIGNASKLKIEVNYASQTGFYDGYDNPYPEVIDSFTVIDENGFKYTFDQVEVTKNNNFSISYPQPGSGGGAVAPVAGDDIPKFRSAWKLSKVETSNDLNLLSIVYKDVVEEPEYLSTTIEHIVDVNTRPYTVGITPSCISALYAQLKPLAVSSTRTTIIDSKKVDYITFRDGVTIEFTSNDNHPEYVGKRLNSVVIKNNGSINKTYDFNYNAAMENTSSLLFLDEVEENNSLAYVFEYTNKENLNAFGQTLSDAFGYYNSGDEQTYKDLVTSGALSSITYPTGGKREFNWQSNTYSYKGDRLLTFDEIFENPDNYTVTPDSQIHNTTNQYQTGGTPPTSAVQSITVNVDHNANVKYEILSGQDYINPFNFTVYYVPITGSGTAGSFILNGNNTTGNVKVGLKTGTYEFHIAQDPFLPVEDPYAQSTLPHAISVRLVISPKSLIADELNWWVYGGGLRMSSVENVDAGQTKSKTAFNYQLESLVPSPIGYPGNPNFQGPTNPTHYYSSGSFDGSSHLQRKYTIDSKPIYNAAHVVENPVRYFVTETNNALDAQMTQGNFIGYKDVAAYSVDTSVAPTPQTSGETIKDESVVKYNFHSPIDFPTFTQGYTYPFPRMPDTDYKRGNAKTVSIYDTDNKLLKQTTNTYNYESGAIEQVVTESLAFDTNENDFANGSDGTGPHCARVMFDNFYSYGQNNPLTTKYDTDICDGSPLSRAVLFTEFGSPFIHVDDLTVGPSRHYDEVTYKVQLTSKETKDYVYDGTEQVILNIPIPDKEVTTNQTFSYNPDNYQISEQNTYVKEKGVNQHWQTKYYYPVGSNLGSNTSIITDRLEDLNKINEVLETESFKNGVKLSETQNIYHEFVSNHVLPQAVKSGKSVTTPESRIEFIKYDGYGNPLELRKSDGVSISYIWGYDNTFPVAKLLNVTFAQIETVLGSNFNAGSGGLTATQISTLKTNFPDAQVSTYEYNTMVGITKMTDSRGYSMTYNYDSFNRLLYVKDQDGNILSENEYNYKNQY
ncbi:hypothetical protein [uncultured Psychroserpens sp.]|uniref:hypothetical protein n=1 Tax=uncultured Psychroserpens sp. TaxID=255436 RepID=UPI00260E7D10|nr:hypothetical protein [uncultured Psychroserpens sp.]